MGAALAELQAAVQTTSALRYAAESAKAELADVEKQTALMNERLKQLEQRVLFLSAPSGIAQVTPGSLQLSAGENLIATAGEDADLSISKKFRLAVGETISLFAKTLGMKLFAASGKVELQAQTDAMDIFSRKGMSIASQEDAVVITAKTELRLECGGAFISMKDGNITVAAPGNCFVKCDMLQKSGPASHNSSIQLPELCASTAPQSAGAQDGVIS